MYSPFHATSCKLRVVVDKICGQVDRCCSDDCEVGYQLVNADMMCLDTVRVVSKCVRTGSIGLVIIITLIMSGHV